MVDDKDELNVFEDIHEHYRNIFQNSLVGIYRSTPDGKVVLANPALIKMLGYSSFKELAQLNLEEGDRFVSISRKDFKDKLETDGMITGMEYKIKTATGDVIIVRENAKVIKNGKGNALYYDGMMEDITEQRRIKDALKEKEELYQSLVAISPVPIILTDMKGNILEASKSAKGLWGYSKMDEFSNKGVISLVADEHREKVKIGFNNLCANRQVNDLQLNFLKSDGAIFIGEVNCSLIYGAEAEPKYVIHTIRDITDQKEMEIEMKKRLMKFNVDNGNIYLIKEVSSSLSLEVFVDLLNVQFEGIVMSRKTYKDFQKAMEGDYAHYWLAERTGHNSIFPSKDEILAFASQLPKRKVVLLDRLDYIISKIGYSETLSMVQSLREIAYYSDHIILFTIDPNVLDERQLAMLNNETKEVFPFQKAWLPEDLLEVLKFVYNENKMGNKPSHTRVSRMIGISKPTAGKRIRQLVDSGFLIESLKGKSKILELSPDGKRLFLENM